MLNLRQRRLARHIARDAWIASKSNGDEAKIIAEADCRVRGLDPATVILIIKMCIEIWIWWQSRNIDEPSVVPSSLEPFDWGDERDD